MPNLLLPGQAAVEVHDSDPEFGKEYQYVWFMEPPFTVEQVERRYREAIKKWIDHMEEVKGRRLTHLSAVRGPFSFFSEERMDLREEHMGEDEFQIDGWFKQDPYLLTLDAVDYWQEKRDQFGYGRVAPENWKHDPEARRGVKNSSNIFADKSHLKPVGWGYDPEPDRRYLND